MFHFMAMMNTNKLVIIHDNENTYTAFYFAKCREVSLSFSESWDLDFYLLLILLWANVLWNILLQTFTFIHGKKPFVIVGNNLAVNLSNYERKKRTMIKVIIFACFLQTAIWYFFLYKCFFYWNGFFYSFIWKSFTSNITNWQYELVKWNSSFFYVL